VSRGSANSLALTTWLMALTPLSVRAERDHLTCALGEGGVKVGGRAERLLLVLVLAVSVGSLSVAAAWHDHS